MAAQPNNLSARVKQLEAAAERAKKVKRGEALSFVPMREIIGVSRQTLTEWCNSIDGFEASGSFVRGGNGVEWAFSPRETVAYLLKHFRGKIAQQGRRSRKIALAVGVSLPDGESAPSLLETRQLVELTLSVTAAQEKMGRYAVAEEVADFISGYNEVVVSGILGVKTSVDPNGNLPVAVRKAMDEELRRLATALHGRAESYVEQKRAGIQQGGIGAAG